MIINIPPKKTGAALARGQSNQSYGTPANFLQACTQKFGPIGFDLAASPENKKAEGFFSKEMDSLSLSWHTVKQLCWLNPPFGDTGKWAKKCWVESLAGARILFLVPASVGSNWYRDYVHGKAQVYFLNGRLTFEGQTQPYPKDCLLAHYDFALPASTGVWNWRTSSDPSNESKRLETALPLEISPSQPKH